MSDRVSIVAITRVTSHAREADQDLVAVESPLELLIAQADEKTESLGLLMRTPGDDEDLSLGLLLAEGIITSAADVASVELRPGPPASPDTPDRAIVTLGPQVAAAAVLRRALAATSACGLCGRLEMRRISARVPASLDAPTVRAEVLASLPDRLRRDQAVFAETGGLHAAALCDFSGEPWLIREDVGRHNAVDKVIGAALALGRLPLTHSILVVSGRVAYEIVQKASAGAVPVIVAIGAPSSLAIDAARSASITLAGFVRTGKFNVYTGAARVVE